jgi:hypothetical protein
MHEGDYSPSYLFLGVSCLALVRMLVSIASPDWSYAPQQEVEIDDDLAAKWVEVGHAEYVKEKKKRSKEGE